MPKVRLRSKLNLATSAVPKAYAAEKKAAVKTKRLEQRIPTQVMVHALEEAQPKLHEVCGRRLALTHSILSVAHALLERAAKNSITLPLGSHRAVAGLISWSMANSARVEFPEDIRWKWRLACKLEKRDMIGAQIFWLQLSASCDIAGDCVIGS